MFLDVHRGYLPENYYEDKRVFKRKPPQLTPSPYPNKIEVDAFHRFAILVKGPNARLQDTYEWMSAHPYIKVRLTSTTPDSSTHLTGNIAIEAYASTQRTYAMVVFRAATVGDEQTNRMLESHGESRKGPCPPPVTGLLCKSEVNIQSVWQWLSLYCGRLVYLVNEPMLHTNIAVLPSGHLRIHSGQSLEQTRLRHDTSRESFDSSLPAYELPPPSIRSSIPEQTEVISPPESPSEDEEEDEDEDDEEFTPPAYWDIARQTEYGRTYASNESDRIARTFTQSMPMLPEPDTQNLYQDIEVALDLGIGSPESNAGARQPVASTSAGRWIPNSITTSIRRSRLSARTNPDYHTTKRRWFTRFLHI